MKHARYVERASFQAVGRKKTAYWVHVPFAEGWRAFQRLAVQDGAIVVSELRVIPFEQPRTHAAGEWSGDVTAVPSGGLTTRLLKRVPIGGSIVAPVVTDWIETMLSDDPLVWPSARALARKARRELSVRVALKSATPAPGRAGRKPTHDRAFYEGIAADYKRWFSEHPARRIAEKRGVSRATARTWIYAARRKGLLPATKPGRLPQGDLNITTSKKGKA